MPYLCTHQPASHVHKTPAYFYLLNSAHEHSLKDGALLFSRVCHLESRDNQRTFPGLAAIIFSWSLTRRKLIQSSSSLFFLRKKIDAQTSIDGLSECVFSIFFILSVSHKIITSWPKFTHVALKCTHPCARASIFFFCVRTSEHARASHDLLCVEIINSIYRSGFRSETPQTGGRDP